MNLRANRRVVLGLLGGALAQASAPLRALAAGPPLVTQPPQAASYSATGAISPASVTPGQAFSYSAAVTLSGTRQRQSIAVTLRLLGPDTAVVQSSTVARSISTQPVIVRNSFPVPSDSPAGSYQVSVIVQSGNRSETLYQNDDLASGTVAPDSPGGSPPPPASDIIWSADTETGDISQWTEAQDGEAVFNTGTGELTVTSAITHSGQYALQLAITGAAGTTQAVRIFRWNDAAGNPLPHEAYYSVWQYYPVLATPALWWNVFQFKSIPPGASESSPTWVLNVGNRRTGEMYFYLWDQVHRRSYPPLATVDVPVGHWTRIEAYLKQSTTRSGAISIWQDGVLLYQLTNVQTTLGNQVHWSVDNYTDDIQPPDVTIYADDAIISTARVP